MRTKTWKAIDTGAAGVQVLEFVGDLTVVYFGHLDYNRLKVWFPEETKSFNLAVLARRFFGPLGKEFYTPDAKLKTLVEHLFSVGGWSDDHSETNEMSPEAVDMGFEVFCDDVVDKFEDLHTSGDNLRADVQRVLNLLHVMLVAAKQ